MSDIECLWTQVWLGIVSVIVSLLSALGSIFRMFDLAAQYGCLQKQLRFQVKYCKRGNSDATIDLDFDLEAWLTARPGIAKAIVWEQPPNNIPQPYPNWTAQQKRDLEDVFWQIRCGDSPNLSAAPPHSNFLSNNGEIFSTELTPDVAWRYFVGFVAQSLAVEQAGWVPWSINNYTAAQLQPLLDSRSLFHYFDTRQTFAILRDHLVIPSHGAGTPGDPARIFAFVRKTSALASPRKTVDDILEWCNKNMTHFVGTWTPADCQAYWQYDGYPPVERVISGTTHAMDGAAHWTAGCWGTNAFLDLVLRTANVPTKLERPIDPDPMIGNCGHALPHFVLVPDAYLSHGDDPYSGTIRNNGQPFVPIDQLLIDQQTFDEWFGPNVARQCRSIGRRVADLAIQNLPVSLLQLYCQDKQNMKDHASGQVYNLMFVHYDGSPPIYTVAELEAMGLWTRMDDKINQVYGGDCKNVM